MKAYVLNDIGDFSLKEVDRPALTEGNVIVKVEAAGICGSDIPRVYTTGAHTHPLILGHEFSGRIVEAEENSKELIGKRVGIYPLIPCGKCTQCKKKNYEMCKNYNYLGSRCNGGFAEYVSVPKWNILELPDEVSYEQAAMLEPSAVAMHAIRRIDMENVKSVAVCGLGTIGLLITMLLKERGIENIITIGNKNIQRKMINKIDDSIYYCDVNSQDVEEFILEKTNGEGVEVFFECVGRNDTLVQGINSTSAKGNIVLVGNPYSDMQMTRDVYWKILRKQIKIQGTWNSSYGFSGDDWENIINYIKEKRISPEILITHRFKFEELFIGFEIMRDKREEYVKIMGALMQNKTE